MMTATAPRATAQRLKTPGPFLLALFPAFPPTVDALDDVTFSFCQILLFAEAAAPAAGAAEGDPTASMMRMLAPMAIIMVLFYFMMIRPQRQKEQQLRDQINNLKENDRVVTIGGIHGVVTNVQRDAERVTIRVDEATGTKLKIAMSAVARIITGEENGTNAGGNKS